MVPKGLRPASEKIIAEGHGGWRAGKSGGEPAAVQTLREVRQSWRARSVWTAVALAPL